MIQKVHNTAHKGFKRPSNNLKTKQKILTSKNLSKNTLAGYPLHFNDRFQETNTNKITKSVHRINHAHTKNTVFLAASSRDTEHLVLPTHIGSMRATSMASPNELDQHPDRPGRGITVQQGRCCWSSLSDLRQTSGSERTPRVDYWWIERHWR